MTIAGVGLPLAVEGAATVGGFKSYVEKVLVPILRTGRIVVTDNLGAHRPEGIRQLIEQQGRELLYLLPACSSDYNPMLRGLCQGPGQKRRGTGGSASVALWRSPPPWPLSPALPEFASSLPESWLHAAAASINAIAMSGANRKYPLITVGTSSSHSGNVPFGVW